MTELAGSRTEGNLRQAYAAATLAHRRYMAIADQALARGDYSVAALLRGIAKSRAGQAEAILARLEPCDDKHSTAYNLRLAILEKLHAGSDTYPAMARTARHEGFDEIAEWFEVCAMAGRSHVSRFHRVCNDWPSGGELGEG